MNELQELVCRLERNFLSYSEAAQPEPLAAVLNGRAIELWSDSFGRLFLVADEADARRLMHSDTSVQRGEVYNADEVRRVIAINDPTIIAEIHGWKLRFDGVIHDER
jgi:hypothetical protein